MRIVNVAVRQCYRFNCPNCGSKLEADGDELVDVGGKTSRFWCPVCREERYIPWSSLRKRTIYEDNGSFFFIFSGTRVTGSDAKLVSGKLPGVKI